MDVSNQADVVPGSDRGPRARTRRLMLESAVRLMQKGLIPSVADVAEEAQVSRATAYRYFPSQAALVSAVVDEALGPILDWTSDEADAGERVDDLLRTSLPRIDEFEATFRAALRHALDEWAGRQAGGDGDDARFRRGHRIELLRDAVAPLADHLPGNEADRLAKALSLIFGVETLVILKDIWGCDAGEAAEIARWAARALVAATMRGD